MNNTHFAHLFVGYLGEVDLGAQEVFYNIEAIFVCVSKFSAD